MVQTKYTTTYGRLFTMFHYSGFLFLFQLFWLPRLRPTEALTLFHLENRRWVWGPEGTSSSGRPRGQRPRIVEEAAIWSWSSHSGWRAGLWLGTLQPPLYGYNQITASYRRQNTPLNKEMMNIRCAIVARVGHRLKTSKCESPPRSFMQEGHDRIS